MIFLAVLYLASECLGVPVAASLQHQQLAALPSFQPGSQAFAAVPMPKYLGRPSVAKLIADAKSVLSRVLEVEHDDLKVSSSFTDNAGILHVYADHLVNGLPCIFTLTQSLTSARKYKSKTEKSSLSSVPWLVTSLWLVAQLNLTLLKSRSKRPSTLPNNSSVHHETRLPQL
jgi:hypothetical protein